MNATDEEVVVNGCCGCPFVVWLWKGLSHENIQRPHCRIGARLWEGKAWDDLLVGAFFEGAFVGQAPDWCPLGEGGLTVRLKTKADYEAEG